MGRGGTGNIGTATSQKNVPFDVSKDPDDNHEDIVREKAAKERKNTPVSNYSAADCPGTADI